MQKHIFLLLQLMKIYILIAQERNANAEMVLKVQKTIYKKWLLLRILGLVLVRKEQEMIINDEHVSKLISIVQADDSIVDNIKDV